VVLRPGDHADAILGTGEPPAQIGLTPTADAVWFMRDQLEEPDVPTHKSDSVGAGGRQLPLATRPALPRLAFVAFDEAGRGVQVHSASRRARSLLATFASTQKLCPSGPAKQQARLPSGTPASIVHSNHSSKWNCAPEHSGNYSERL
jgi:hypothetical protein